MLTGISRWLVEHTIISLTQCTQYIKVPLRIISCCNHCVYAHHLRQLSIMSDCISLDWWNAAMMADGVASVQPNARISIHYLFQLPIMAHDEWPFSNDQFDNLLSALKFREKLAAVQCPPPSIHPSRPRAETETHIDDADDAGVVLCCDALTFNAIRNVEFISLSIQNSYLCIRIIHLNYI